MTVPRLWGLTGETSEAAQVGRASEAGVKASVTLAQWLGQGPGLPATWLPPAGGSSVYDTSGLFCVEYLVLKVNWGMQSSVISVVFLKVSNIFLISPQGGLQKVQYSFPACLEAVCRVRSPCPCLSAPCLHSPLGSSLPLLDPCGFEVTQHSYAELGSETPCSLHHLRGAVTKLFWSLAVLWIGSQALNLK